MLNIKITAYPHYWGAYAIVNYLFSEIKASVVLLIGSFCSANKYLILTSSHVPWCSHQPMNGVWKELTPPSLSIIYIFLIIFHANFKQKSSSVGIPYQRNTQ